MLTKETVTREIEIRLENLLKEFYDFILFVKKNSSYNEEIQAHLASEAILSKDWNLKAKEEAWKDL